MSLHRLFGVPVALSSIDATEKERARWVKAVLAAVPVEDDQPDRVTIGSSSQDLHLNPFLAPLFSRLKCEIESYAYDHLKLSRGNVRLSIGRCWPVVQRGGEGGPLHYHAGATISGVLYLQLPTDDAGVVFTKGETFALDLLQKSELNSTTGLDVEFVPTEGDVVLFPSELRHRAQAQGQPSRKPRVAIAFDVFSSSNIENIYGGQPHPHHLVPLEELGSVQTSDTEKTRLLRDFYQVPRMGQLFLSDGGGPFGFDIQLACEVDWLVRAYGCDAVIETGCNMGDTTEYLCNRYPDRPVFTCDVEGAFVDFVKERLALHSNVKVAQSDSVAFLEHTLPKFKRPFLFLDAHGVGKEWPLTAELSMLKRGVICVHDFDIGHERFDYDTYEGVKCDPTLLAQSLGSGAPYFINHADADYPLPCLQVGRRSGRAFIVRGLPEEPAATCPYLTRRVLP